MHLKGTVTCMHVQTMSKRGLQKKTCIAAAAHVYIEHVEAHVHVEHVEAHVHVEHVEAHVHVEHVEAHVHVEHVEAHVHVEHVEAHVNVEHVEAHVHVEHVEVHCTLNIICAHRSTCIKKILNSKLQCTCFCFSDLEGMLFVRETYRRSICTHT